MNLLRTLSVLVPLTSLVMLAASSGCSVKPKSNEDFMDNTPTGSGGAKSTGSGDTSAGVGGDFNPSTTAGSGGASSCATTDSKAEPVRVNLFIMLDQSGSMDQNNKWNNVTAALLAFFSDQGSAGLGVALKYFPEGACDGSQCDVNACAKFDVPIAQLTTDPAPKDTQESALSTSIMQHGPNGNTPTYAALAGAEQAADAYAAAHPNERVAVLLATDGEPNGCDEDFNHISKLASDSKSSNNVLTFAIGFQGSNQQQLDMLAVAGGTMNAFMIGNGNAEQDLVNALKAIQGKQVACDYQLPTTSPSGDPVDPKQINVSYQPGNGGMPQQILNVANAGACGPNGGWYYDDPANPKTVTLCPSTCMAIQGDDMAKVSLQFGCATKQTT